MNYSNLNLRSASVAIAALLVISGMSVSTVGAKPRVAKASAESGSGLVTLNFNNAEIEAIARTIASMGGGNVVIDPRIKGTISLSSATPVTPAQALRLFALQLRAQGYAVIESSGLYVVVPEAEAKLHSAAVSSEPQPVASGQVVTQIFRLNHEDAKTLVPILRPLISPNNTINVSPGSNALVVTDYAENAQRLGRIIAALDVANATGVDLIRLKHGLAGEMAVLVQRLLDANPASQTPGETAYRTVVFAEGRSNALIVRAANAARLALARTLIDQLDQPNVHDGAGGNIHVVHLKNADAVKLAATLRAAMGAGGVFAAPAGSTVSAPVAGSPAVAAPVQPATGGQIQADPATNSLVITAPEPQFRQLRAVIDRLDVRRAQVYVESLIAEVSADKAAEFGIQWQGALGRAGDANIGVLGTNFNVGGSNIISLAAQGASGAVVPSSGINLGVATQVNGVYTLGFLARFLQKNGDANVLSTPNLLTLDNEEAKIVIGQNVPFVTGQYTTNVSNNGMVNPFQTIERKDVGLTLRVKPQISENGTIKMQIYQEVSRLDPASLGASAGLITNKRSIESSVMVEDGSIVVLGGLLQDDYGSSQEKVPGLGELPVVGNLFRSESRSRRKTNLMVFLRPVVVRDGRATEALSVDRYEQLRASQLQAQPVPSNVTPVNSAPVLPPAPVKAPASPTK